MIQEWSFPVRQLETSVKDFCSSVDLIVDFRFSMVLFIDVIMPTIFFKRSSFLFGECEPVIEGGAASTFT